MLMLACGSAPLCQSEMESSEMPSSIIQKVYAQKNMDTFEISELIHK